MVKKIPKLKFTKKTILNTIKKLVDEKTLIITDDYGYELLKELGKTKVIKNNNSEQIAKIKSENHYSKIIAVGGCTALDIGRACAVNKEIIVFPTILSTSCISVDRSVISYHGRNVLEKTIAPTKTIVSMPSITETYTEELKKWSQSGFGDLFANISASIDLQSKKGNLNMKSIRENVPECFKALEWVVKSFEGYNTESLKKLANYLHKSSLIVIKRGDTQLSAAGEHELYHKMIEKQKQYTQEKPTHGQLVAVGTLISAKILGDKIKDYSLYNQLRTAYEKLGLALDYKELEKEGIKRSHIIKGLNDIRDTKTFLGDYFKSKQYKTLDVLFRGE